MKKSKLFKTLLIPTIGISVIAPIAAVLTSCGSEDPGINVREYVGITSNANSTLTLYNEEEIIQIWNIQLMVELVEIHIAQQ